MCSSDLCEKLADFRGGDEQAPQHEAGNQLPYVRSEYEKHATCHERQDRDQDELHGHEDSEQTEEPSRRQNLPRAGQQERGACNEDDFRFDEAVEEHAHAGKEQDQQLAARVEPHLDDPRLLEMLLQEPTADQAADERAYYGSEQHSLDRKSVV